MCMCMCKCECECECECVVSLSVALLLVCRFLFFRGKILGFVRRRTTTKPFTKDVVIDHERRLGE